ncbi:MAG TPA: AAA family ATPase [Candidatus Methylacidiphilales bacterium]|jgi:MoxR-like ATPase|nr:AAA family ATPase [Candidatus Methylacidiphilales bacterium]
MSELLIIRVPHQQESAVALNGEPLVIGSNPSSHIVVNDPAVLPHHAYLARDQGHWRVAAYDAAVPLTFENAPTTDLRLDNGTRFSIGHTQFEFASDRAVGERTTRESGSLNLVPERRAAAGDHVAPERRGGAGENPILDNPEAAAAQLHQAMSRIRTEMARVVIGQEEVVNQILVALFGRGHCLLVGTPGLAKTLMARTLADSLELQCRRVQFTPDLMPADITGTQVLEQDPATSARHFVFKHGPIFTNLLLADEINRTPPKTQAALLEAMQERRVTISGQSYDLPSPFFVIATQNPIEQEGTYPLPEAQLDRFMFSVKVGYPSAEEEERIVMETTRDASQEVDRVLGSDLLLNFQHLVRKTPVSRHVGAYATRLVRATRPDAPDAADFIKNWVRWGAGPRAGQYMVLAAKSHALLQGRLNVSCDDVRSYALPVLRHRVLCNFAAASEGVDSDEIVRRLLETVPEPDYAGGE